MRRIIILAALATLLGAGPAAAAPPANDNFADAIPIVAGIPQSGPGITNVDATLEPGEPDAIGLYPPATGATVWFSISPSTTGSYLIKSCGDVNTVMALYTGSTVASASRFGVGNDDGCLDGWAGSSLTKVLTAGQTYKLQVGGYGLPMTSTSPLEVSVDLLPSAPANDAFANAATLNPASPTAPWSTQNASDEVGEPNPFNLNHTVWYRWTAPTSGPRLITCTAPNVSGDGILGVYTGATLNALSQTVLGRCNDTPFLATAGTTYDISVAMIYGGAATLTIEPGGLVGPGATDTGGVPAGRVGAVTTLTFTNTAARAVTVGGGYTRGADTADFAVLTDGTCISQGALAPGATCTMRVRFSPSALGARSTTLVLDGSYTEGFAHGLDVSTVPLTGTGTSRTGPTGQAGPVGPTGSTGPIGVVGPAGGAGSAGPTGPAGQTGSAGSAGSPGAAGPQGAAGAAGPTGPAGPAGASGAQGAAGPPGTTSCKAVKPKGKPGKKLKVRCVVAVGRSVRFHYHFRIG